MARRRESPEVYARWRQAEKEEKTGRQLRELINQAEYHYCLARLKDITRDEFFKRCDELQAEAAKLGCKLDMNIVRKWQWGDPLNLYPMKIDQEEAAPNAEKK